MALAVRFQSTPNALLRHPSGRTYSANGNGIVDIPAVDAEQIHGQGQRIAYTGTTSDRPKPDGRLNWPPPRFIDSTLSGATIYWSGTGWTDAAGNPA
jgi:hypothetical protein